MNLTGKTVLVTGGVTGVGEATARILARDVRRLFVHGVQPLHTVSDLLEELRGPGQATVEYFQADFTRLSEVSDLARRVRDAGGADILINNAVAPATNKRIVTSDGIEETLQVNYLAMVKLVTELHDVIRHRIVNVASETHQSADLNVDDLQLEHGYSAFDGYRRSKLAIVTFSQWVAGKLGETGSGIVTVCPGLTETPLLHDMFPGLHGQSPVEAAKNVLAGLDDALPNGAYLSSGRIKEPNPIATNPDTQTRLVEATNALLDQDIRDLVAKW
ncbi:SDR family NAD(P)-dependent oxidoreductase [Bifidobacterium psychraerophilum]|uniref:Short-chain dehydrogenase/reductase SDR n=2 Tax=Bifidobacterium psychraerophilum TaxID=218140 RepID=A0A087CF73_9BIFI|nr:SDR family NAD(P)-dependent oxidoreductase [Bifidobacterium psychraerophilum]KFI81923.1 short-chain dehydrogenase/reductase SDR [Bifidobacterium psychraerophilum]PKA94728.1 dehydrogenase/reductase SDR family protein 13 [Bifidobacterium psychraerophilum DSM 22366]